MTWALRRAIKIPLAMGGALREGVRRSVNGRECTFLIYHRVTGEYPLELDLEPKLFERQIEHLAVQETVIDYESALQQLQSSDPAGVSFVVLTFDDGYEDFYTGVYPLLLQYSLPAILFVTTGFVEEQTPYPMLSHPELQPEPVTWDMLGEMSESGMVTIGAHTHTHPILTHLPVDKVEEELVRSMELFRSRLGVSPKHFAYPRAEMNERVDEVVRQHYESAVVGGGYRATSLAFDRYRIPRIPIRRSDGFTFFKAKLNGWMQYEEPLYQAAHTILRRGRS